MQWSEPGCFFVGIGDYALRSVPELRSKRSILGPSPPHTALPASRKHELPKFCRRQWSATAGGGGCNVSLTAAKLPKKEASERSTARSAERALGKLPRGAAAGAPSAPPLIRRCAPPSPARGRRGAHPASFALALSAAHRAEHAPRVTSAPKLAVLGRNRWLSCQCHSRESGNPGAKGAAVAKSGFPLSRE
jgi:hypothetical protein